jgi:hypothetical protein
MYLGFEIGIALPMEILAFHFIPNECDLPWLCDTTGHLDVQFSLIITITMLTHTS